MQQQNEADEKLKSTSGASSGGTRWSGASKKKGSVTSYAKDVQEKLKKQAARDKDRDPSQRATAAARRTQRAQKKSQSGFNDKGV